jgi:hypothetical protein
LLKFNRLTAFLTVAAFALLGNLDTALAQTLVATPNPVNFNVQTGGSAPSQNVNITLNGASVTVQSVSASTTTGQNWLLPSVGSSSVFVSVNASGLTAGTYNGTVTANTASGTISFPVNLTVAATPTLNVNPSALNFAYQAGTPAPLPQTISLTSSGGAANATVTSSTSSGGTQWLIVSPTGQLTTPSNITVNIQPAGLAAGSTYMGNIQIVSSGGGANGTVNIPVSLLVSNNPIIAANPASLTFTAQVGNAAPSQSLSLTSSGGPLTYTAASSVGSPTGGNWLQVPSQSGTTSGAITVAVNTSGLAVGTYIGAINVTAPNAGNGNLSVPVTLNITAGPVLQLSVPSLSFAYQIGQSQPLSQTVTVGSTSGQVGFTVATQTSSGGQWLSASPTNGIAPGNFVVSVNTAGLTQGTYNGSITVTPTTTTSAPQTITVALVVSNTALLVLSPNAASFTVTAGSSSSSFQNVAVTSTDASALSFSVTKSAGADWLLVNTSSGSTPANLTISANPAGLTVGTYTGTVTVTATAGSVINSPQTLPVTLNVTSSNTLSVTPSSLSFTQAVNGPAPASQTLTVTSTGASSGSQITFAAAVTLNQGQNWLTVTPTNATTPATLTVTANGAGLVAGTYTGQILLSSPGVAQQTVNVTLAVGSSSGGFNNAGSMAHLASAGLWKTIFTLVNTGTTSATARLNFFDDNGNPLALPLTFPQTSSTAQLPVTTLDRTLGAGATLIIESTGPDTQTTQVGWAQLLTNGSVNGFAVFRQTVPSGQHEAVVPLETRTAGAYVLSFDNTSGFVTGVAMANASTQAANIAVTIKDDNGTVIQSNTIALPALGHSAFDLTIRLPVTAQRRGTVEFQTPAGGQISVLGIRFNPAGTFSTVPPLAK